MGAAAVDDDEDDVGTGGGGIGSLGCSGKPGGKNCAGLGNAGLKLGGMKLGGASGFIIEEIDIGFAASPLNNDRGSDIFVCDKSDGFNAVCAGSGGMADACETTGGVGSVAGFFSFEFVEGLAFTAGE